MKPSFYTFNPPGALCRCRCYDNHPDQNFVCDPQNDATVKGVCDACSVLLCADRATVIRDLVGVLEGTRSNPNQLMSHL